MVFLEGLVHTITLRIILNVHADLHVSVELPKKVSDEMSNANTLQEQRVYANKLKLKCLLCNR